MNPLKNLFSKVFEQPPSTAKPASGEDAAFEWNPDEETVAPTSAKSVSWRRPDTVEPPPAPRDAAHETQTVEIARSAHSLPAPSFETPAVPPVAVAVAPAPTPVVDERITSPDTRLKPSFVDEPAPPVPAAPAPLPAMTLAPLSDFEDVYRKAGIKSPVHGYGVERVYRLLTSRRLSGLDRNVRRSALLTALDAAGVPASDVAQDAVLRRKALAAYEAEKALELQSLRSRNESRVEALQDTVETFTRQKQSQIERLAQGSTAAVRAQSDLEIRKRMEQDRLYRSLAYFVEPLPSPALEARPTYAETLRPAERFEATIEAPLPKPAPARVIDVEVPKPVPAEAPPAPTTSAPSVSEASAPVPAPVVEAVTVAPPADEAPADAGIPASGLEIALRAAAEEARKAGWGQSAIVEDSAGDKVEALRKLREGGKTEPEQ